MGRKEEKKMQRDQQPESTFGAFATYGPQIIGAFLVFLGVSVLYTFRTGGQTGDLRYVEVNQPDDLKEILFSGNPHVVLCSHMGFQAREQSAYDEMKGEVPWVFVDCLGKLPSGKTVPERVKLAKDQPQAFVSTGDRWWQLPTGNATKIVGFIRDAMKPRAIEVKSPADFKKKCTDTPACVVVGFHHKLDKSLRDLVLEAQEKARGVRVVTVSAQNKQLQLDEALLATRPKGGKDRLTPLFGVAKVGDSSHGRFVQDVSSAADLSALFSKLSESPASLARLSSPPRLHALDHKAAKKVDPEAKRQEGAASTSAASTQDDEDDDDFVVRYVPGDSTDEASREDL